MDCIFCKIAKKEIPAEVISENEYFIAFLDVNPLVEGHTLVASKRHFEKWRDMDKEEAKEIAEIIKKVEVKLENTFGCDTIISNSSGKQASQSVEHFHVHIIPRKFGDRLWDERKSRIVLDRSSGFERLEISKEKLEEIGEKIRNS